MFAGFLATVYAIAVPVHLAVDHARADRVHHAHDHGTTSHDARGNDASHRMPAYDLEQGHPGHDHSVQDHVIVRTRTAYPHVVLAAIVVAAAYAEAAAPICGLDALEAPPPKNPTLTLASLRGPPVG